MILVMVGMHTQPFDRLVCAADALASVVEERVIIQRGASRHVPRFAQYVDTVDEAQIRNWLVEARVVISHAGAGSILSALQAGKPLVLAPRTARFDEHFDDHQLELAEVLSERGRAVTVTDLSASTLVDAIERAANLTGETLCETGLHAALRGWLEEQSTRTPLAWTRLLQRRQGGS